MRTQRLTFVFAALLAAGVATLSACGDDGTSGGETCTNGTDDDGDGATDCLDTDCAADPACASPPEEVDCDDNRDDDGDGDTDCDDSDCAANPACTTAPEANCTNTVDDDDDGDTDCDDSDCADDPACAGTHETNCTNTVDDDDDGATDCDDEDCVDDPACAPDTETNCGNDLDDDGDGDTDCADTDCADDPACTTTPETNCTNLVDDDGDGDTDCADTDCFGAPACTTTPETNCTNLVDDDGDGDTDCADSDCTDDPACATTCTEDAREDNDVVLDATDVTLVTPTESLTSASGDDDLFAIDVCRGAEVTIDVTFTHALGDIDVYLVDDAGTELDRSASGDDNEQIVWTSDRLATVYLAVQMYDAGGCNTYHLAVAVDRTACVLVETVCDDLVDDDGDGAVDCADSDCAARPVCVPETNCANGVDDDTDGLTDCADPGCAADPACAVVGGDSCTDGPFVLPDDPTGVWRGSTASLVNDHNASCGGSSSPEVVFQFELTARASFVASTAGSGFDTLLYLRGDACTPGTELACNDDGTGIAPASRVQETLDAGSYWLFVDGYRGASGAYILTVELRDPEVCTDTLDNDGDGATDCADDDCSADPACFESICDDTLDNDGDGDTDCADSDCVGEPACVETLCGDTLDNDRDGDTDCADSDCVGEPACVETLCADTLDNDRDGATDCADADCAADPACFESSCTDTVDNDGDGDTDCADVECTFDPACTPACVEDAREDNDTRAAATDSALVTSSEWLAVLPADNDYFSIPVCVGATVAIDASFRHSRGDIDIALQSDTGTNLRISQTMDDGEHIDWTSDLLGTVYLRVYLYGSSSTCNLYHLAVTVDRTACP